LFINIASSKTQKDPSKIIKIFINNNFDRKIISSLNLDIIESREQYVIAIAREKDIERIISNKFSYEILISNTHEFYKKIKKLDNYHTDETLYNDLVTLAQSEIVDLISIGKSTENRDIWALKIAQDVSINDQNKTDVFIIALLHAREWVGMEVAYKFAEYLVLNKEVDEIKKIIDEKEIWIIPVANPDGFYYSINTDRLWRKNRKINQDNTYGVDLNRNFDIQFGVGGTSETESEVYQGESSFSENETMAIRDLLKDKEVGGVIDLHSFGQYVLYPWGYTKEHTEHLDFFDDLSIKFINLIKGNTGNLFQYGQPPDLLVLGDGVGGSLLDYAYSTYKIPSFVIELAPKSFDYGGFELPANEVDNAFLDVRNALIYFSSVASQKYFEETNIQTGCGVIQ
jgi:hypothetical protein